MSLTYFSETPNMSSSPPPLTELAGAADYIPQIPHHSPSSSSFGNLSPSILIIILILGITVVASVSLCFLLRHLNRRCLRHLSSSSSVAATTITASAAVSSRRVSPENLADSLLDSLPLFVFSAVTRRGGGGGGGDSGEADCAVCLSKFEPEDQLRLLPLCCHAFHAVCVDTWLRSNQTCPLCRSSIFASEADILKTLGPSSSARIEIGNVSRREATPSDRNDSRRRSARSYSIGSSFEYFVDDESEIVLGNVAHRRTISDFKDDNRMEIMVPETAATEPSLVADVASSGRSWLKDYVDRLSTSLSSRAASFRSSGRFFGGSSRRSDVVLGGEREWDLEANRVGEEISELFRWASGV